MNSKNKYQFIDKIIYIFILIVFYFLQSNSQIFNYNTPSPSYLLAFILIISFFENYWISSIFGLVIGIMIDSISIGGSGFHALLYMITGLFCSIFLKRYFQKNFASFAFISAPVIIVHQFIELLYSSGFTTGIFTLFFKFNIIVSIYTFVVAFVLFIIFKYLIKKDENFVKPKGIINKK